MHRGPKEGGEYRSWDSTVRSRIVATGVETETKDGALRRGTLSGPVPLSVRRRNWLWTGCSSSKLSNNVSVFAKVASVYPTGTLSKAAASYSDPTDDESGSFRRTVPCGIASGRAQHLEFTLKGL